MILTLAAACFIAGLFVGLNLADARRDFSPAVLQQVADGTFDKHAEDAVRLIVEDQR